MESETSVQVLGLLIWESHCLSMTQFTHQECEVNNSYLQSFPKDSVRKYVIASYKAQHRNRATDTIIPFSKDSLLPFLLKSQPSVSELPRTLYFSLDSYHALSSQPTILPQSNLLCWTISSLQTGIIPIYLRLPIKTVSHLTH